MRWYLAASYGRRVELQRYARDLAGMGHEVTARWLSGSHDGLLDTTDDVALRGTWAQEDVADIWRADALIAFPPPIAAYVRGGMYVEVGMALALAKRVLSVGGHRPNVFFCLPEVEVYDSWDAAMEAIGWPDIP